MKRTIFLLMFALCLYASSAYAMEIYEPFEYGDIDFVNDIKKNDCNNEAMNNGTGWMGSWFYTGVGACDVNNPKIIDGKFRNWSQDIKFKRYFAENLDFSSDGVIYGCVELSDNLYDSPEKKEVLDVKFNLGSNLFFGVVYDSEKSGYVPQLGAAPYYVKGEQIKKLQGKKYNLKIKFEVNKNKTDKIYLKVYDFELCEPSAWDIEIECELSQLSADYFEFTIGGYIPTVIDNIVIERCNFEKYWLIKNKGTNLNDSDINALDSNLAKDDFLSVINFPKEKSEPVYSYFTDINTNQINGNNFKTAVTEEKRGMYGVVNVKNTKSDILNLKTAFALYDKCGRLICVSAKTVDVAGNSYSGLIYIGFDGVNNLLPVTTFSGYKAKLFLWEEGCKPFSESITLEYEGNDLTLGVMSDIYVNPDNGYGNGSQEYPFGNIYEAFLYIKNVNEENKYPENGITVHLADGIYNMNKGLELTQIHSGTQKAPVKVIGSHSVLSGGKYININEFSPVAENSIKERIRQEAEDKIVCVKLTNYGIEWEGKSPYTGHSCNIYNTLGIEYNAQMPMQVYVGTKTMTQARYPNEGYITIDNVISEGTKLSQVHSAPDRIENSRIYIDCDRTGSWENAPYPMIFGYFKYNWTDLGAEIKNIENGVIETGLPAPYGVDAGQKIYVYNLLEELDSPGEWYIEDSVLYFYPPEDCEEVMITLMDEKFLSMYRAENIIFENIDFCGTRNDGISLTECENVIFDGCEVSCVAQMGVKINGSGCEFRNGKIFECGKGGINISGGNNITLEAGSNLAQNNEIYNYSLINKCYSPGVRLAGVGNKALNNHIYNASHLAVNFIGNDHIIEGNEINNVLKETDDMGAVYGGRSKIGRGNVIKNNYIHDLVSDETFYNYGITGVFLDDLLDGTYILDNKFDRIEGSGVKINGGRDNIITGNEFSDVSYTAVEFHAYGLYMSSITEEIVISTYEGLSDGLYCSESYSKYANLSTLLEDDLLVPKYNVIKENTLKNSPDTKLILFSSITEEDMLLFNEIVKSENIQ